jgi:D-serine deaminase-like pyridoxal phosphate-dependent protein
MASLVSIGDRVWLIPNPVCSTVNLVNDVTVMAGGSVIDRYPVAARGGNT